MNYLNAMGRDDEAIAHGKRATELDPLTAYFRSDLGWSYVLARRYDEAIAECQQALDIDPRLYGAYWGLGIAYWQKGLFDEAVAAYERAVDLEPNDLWVKGDLALGLCGCMQESPVTTDPRRVRREGAEGIRVAARARPGPHGGGRS